MQLFSVEKKMPANVWPWYVQFSSQSSIEAEFDHIEHEGVESDTGHDDVSGESEQMSP